MYIFVGPENPMAHEFRDVSGERLRFQRRRCPIGFGE